MHNHRPTDRLEYFSDAVLAIAATLLATDLPKPDAETGLLQELAKLWPHYEIPEIPTWHRGRMLLIGDGAHALPPNGQGAAMAFEDAVYLARLIGANPEAGHDRIFAHFERVRRARIDAVRKGSQAVRAPQASTPSPLVWYLKTCGMAAFFWWKGGVMRDTRITAFDVRTEPVTL